MKNVFVFATLFAATAAFAAPKTVDICHNGELLTGVSMATASEYLKDNPSDYRISAKRPTCVAECPCFSLESMIDDMNTLTGSLDTDNVEWICVENTGKSFCDVDALIANDESICQVSAKNFTQDIMSFNVVTNDANYGYGGLQCTDKSDYQSRSQQVLELSSAEAKACVDLWNQAIVKLGIECDLAE